jgi:hypothetical protein
MIKVPESELVLGVSAPVADRPVVEEDIIEVTRAVEKRECGDVMVMALLRSDRRDCGQPQATEVRPRGSYPNLAKV